MLSFIFRRFLTAIPTLFLIITISFFLVRLAPGGPFDLERPLEAKVMENLNRIYKLDRSLSSNTCSMSARSRAEISVPPSSCATFRSPNFCPRPAGLDDAGRARDDPRGCHGRHARQHCSLSAEQPIDYRVTGSAPSASPSRPSWSRQCCRSCSGLRCRGVPVAGWNRLAEESDPAGHHPVATADRRRRAHDPRRDDRESALQPHPDPALARPADQHHRPPRVARRGFPVVSYLGPAAAALLTGSVVVETIFAFPASAAISSRPH